MEDQRDYHFTGKQMAIMKVLVVGNGWENGEFIPCDLNQLLERLEYRTTKASIQFSIRKLIKRGMIVKGDIVMRRGMHMRVLFPTKAARERFASKLNSYIESEDVDLEI